MRARAQLTNEYLEKVWVHTDQSGWDCPEGRGVLEAVRRTIVRREVHAAGLRAAVAAQAEATGWSTAWEVLASQQLRTARNPWGVVTIAVRRAIRGEVVAALYQTDVRTAWRCYSTLAPLRSIDTEVIDSVQSPQSGCVVFDPIAHALVEVGWDSADVETVVNWIAERGRNPSGWRQLAARSGLPPWRVRRLCRLLVGVDGQPGLIERVGREGPTVLGTSSICTALRATTSNRLPSPIAA